MRDSADLLNHFHEDYSSFVSGKRLRSEPSVLLLVLSFSDVAHYITLKTVNGQNAQSGSEYRLLSVTQSVVFCAFMLIPFIRLCRVEEAYRRISGPACVTVDAGPSADQVLQQVQLLIRGKCHL